MNTSINTLEELRERQEELNNEFAIQLSNLRGIVSRITGREEDKPSSEDLKDPITEGFIEEMNLGLTHLEYKLSTLTEVNQRLHRHTFSNKVLNEDSVYNSISINQG